MKTKFSKRLTSLFLVLMMIVGMVPLSALAAEGDTNPYYNRVVDANTMDGWRDLFPMESTNGTPLSTENAGGVWTDKSVFSNTDAFTNLKDTEGKDTSITMYDDEKNFLTVLSTIAANKEIVGYSTVPTDTVFVLDLSGSMSSDSVSQLVTATNNAINKLTQLNDNNRVGVVLYSGSSTNRTYNNAVAQLMPIDRYTTTDNNGRYINYSGGTVSLNNRVTGTKGNITTESKSRGGATYIQAGLWEAYEMFGDIAKANDTVIGQGNWQSGKARMPIVVLMSDGAPSLGTTYFADVKNSTYGNENRNATKANVGDGNDNGMTVGQGFLVQLTASYIKNRIENLYGVKEENGAGRSLFYTLGFNIGSINQEARDIATSVLNPDASTVTDSLWNTYNGLTATNNTMEVRVEGRGEDEDEDYIDVSITKNSYATSKSYVDGYFAASDDDSDDDSDDELAQAFDDIVEEILIQSRYYPTHLEGGNPDFSGYVEYTDTLGEYMEVKQINGILLGDTLFDGHMMASKLNDRSSDGLGTPDNPTALGNEFIRSVQNRLGISNIEDARKLVAAAYNAEQLCYITDRSGNVTKWSNYIGWYGDAAGEYIGHWDETSTQAVPENAVYKIKSYGLLGKTTGSIKNSDMMYMVIQVKTDIATGAQTVTWKVPAALVPMITYLVEVDGTRVDTATNVRIKVEDQNVAPIRLVYETGLRSDLNEFNITRITDEEHVAADGHTRIFWNNYFANLGDKDITALAEFTPNKENERFYYTFDSAVYKKVAEDTYELVTKEEGLDPENKTYYHRRYIFRTNSDLPIFFFEQMSKESVSVALQEGYKADFETLDHQTVGAWYVPAGTPARELHEYDKQKIENLTNSSKMVFQPYLTEQNNLVYVDMNLGNNGLLFVTPATGIKISKTVDVFETGTSDTFKFRITATESGTFDSWITDLDATPSGEATKVTLRNGVYEFEMKKDQTFWLTGLSANTAYTVEEISNNDDYKIKSVHVNGISTGKAAAGTITQYLIDDVDFVNTAVGEGDLVITKQVVDRNGNTVDVNDNIEFAITVALTNASGAPVSGTFEATGGNITIPANGMFTVKLSDGESFVVRGIPEETQYIVTENKTAGFTLNEAASSLTGTVDATANDQALVVNTYTPEGTDGEGISVEVTKTISGNRNTWREGESYTFTLERLNTARSASTVIATNTISDSDNEKKIRFSLENEDYTAAGTYYYSIKETVGSQGGITYDTAERSFAVVVADSDMDGDLEITAVNNEVNTTVSKNGNTYTVAANFNNVYAPTGSAAVTIHVEKKMVGDYRLNGFQFALYNSEDIANADEVLRSTVTDAEGKASFSLSYAANRATLEGDVHTYWMAEINTGNPNIRYDDTVYQVEITVKDNGDGTVSATTVILGLKQGDTDPTFTNTFVPSASAYVTLTANKTVEGDRVLNANEFDFVIEAITEGAPMPAATTVHNAANGAVVFDSIEFTEAGTYQYKIYESDADKIGGFTYDSKFYEVTVVVTDNGDATLSAAVTKVVKASDTDTGHQLLANEIMSFTNAYDPTDAAVIISGNKILTGKTMQADEFEFKLEAVTEGAPMPAAATVNNAANGAFAFGKITYAKAGTYVYTVTETKGTDTRYGYDDSVYTVTVVVTDNSVGRLSAVVTLKKNDLASTEIVFRNSFVPTPLNYDINTGFAIRKELSGKPLEGGEFEFILINAISGEQIGEAVTNDATGEIDFPALSLPDAGTYHYKIMEEVGGEKGITYDTTVYHVVVDVKQGDNGELSVTSEKLYIGNVSDYEDITESGEIVFNNTYKADPAHVTLEATKILTGRELVNGEFKFDLHKTKDDFAYDENTLWQNDVALTLNDDGTGYVRFMPIMFDAEGTYNYVIVEDELDENGVTSDDTVYEVEVTVTDNQEGDLIASLKVNGVDVNSSTTDAIVFNNTYKAAATEIVIKGTKTLNGRDLVADEFSFELYDEGGSKLQTVKNAADGTFAFAAIPVEKEGKYVYTVKEVQGNGEGITYDTAIYAVTATVTDNLDGTFKVEYTYAKGTETANGVTFLNIYTKPTPDPEPNPDPDPEPEYPDSPQTGDNTNLNLWFALLFVSGGGLIGTTLYGRKRRKEEN